MKVPLMDGAHDVGVLMSGELERLAGALRTTGVHDPLGNAFVVEVGELLAGVEVLQQRGTTAPARRQ